MPTALANEVVSLPRMKDAWKAMRAFWEDVLPEAIDKEMAQGVCGSAALGRHDPLRAEPPRRRAALGQAKKIIERAPVVWRPAAPERRRAPH
jgi:hypothetical protein